MAAAAAWCICNRRGNGCTDSYAPLLPRGAGVVIGFGSNRSVAIENVSGVDTGRHMLYRMFDLLWVTGASGRRRRPSGRLLLVSFRRLPPS